MREQSKAAAERARVKADERRERGEQGEKKARGSDGSTGRLRVFILWGLGLVSALFFALIEPVIVVVQHWETQKPPRRAIRPLIRGLDDPL